MVTENAEVLLRSMELQSYYSVVSVLRAQGPLSEEKLEILKMLRSCLGISMDRHKAEIRRALNDTLLGKIAGSLNPAIDVDNAWQREGARTLSLLPSVKASLSSLNSCVDELQHHKVEVYKRPSFSWDKSYEVMPSTSADMHPITKEIIESHSEPSTLVDTTVPKQKGGDVPNSIDDKESSQLIVENTVTDSVSSLKEASTNEALVHKKHLGKRQPNATAKLNVKVGRPAKNRSLKPKLSKLKTPPISTVSSVTSLVFKASSQNADQVSAVAHDECGTGFTPAVTRSETPPKQSSNSSIIELTTTIPSVTSTPATVPRKRGRPPNPLKNQKTGSVPVSPSVGLTGAKTAILEGSTKSLVPPKVSSLQQMSSKFTCDSVSQPPKKRGRPPSAATKKKNAVSKQVSNLHAQPMEVLSSPAISEATVFRSELNVQKTMSLGTHFSL